MELFHHESKPTAPEVATPVNAAKGVSPATPAPVPLPAPTLESLAEHVSHLQDIVTFLLNTKLGGTPVSDEKKFEQSQVQGFLATVGDDKAGK